MKKYVYFFGGGQADGNEKMKELLGGKGANLAEMAGHPDLKLPVPSGFTITTEVCTYFYKNNKKYPAGLDAQVKEALARVEKLTGKKFGDPLNPLLVSVRSGARKSMPGMMETVLNVGLTEKTIPGLIKLTKNERFVYDAYRRLIMMYSDVVMEKAAGIEPEDDMGIRKQLEKIMGDLKHKKGVNNDADLDATDLKQICELFKAKVKEVLGRPFPEDHTAQFWGGISSVFSSWTGKRAVSYRRIEKIPDDWGTAVNVQAMVFGNMGADSATGVAFTRNPGNGDNHFYGEYLINAQGEDVVAGIRTPAPVNEISKSEHGKDMLSLEKAMPSLYDELFGFQKKLERHYRDMQDLEFTIEKGKLYILQCRIGKRNGPAAVKMAVDMFNEKLITNEQAVLRVTPDQIDELLHPIVDAKAEKENTLLAKGLPAGPGGASGRIVFSAKDAVEWKKSGKSVILVREETNPEDVEGMRAAEAILTVRGGMTSHAALVARGWGKCCIVGCGALQIDYQKKTLKSGEKLLKEGEWITLNGTKGIVYAGKLPMVDPSEENNVLSEFLNICNSVRKLRIRANADTPDDAKKAKQLGAEGIGLFRIEHMFYGKGSDEPLFRLRKMIVSETKEERKAALEELYPYMKADIKATLKTMENCPVTIRLIDPPLHEFVPHDKERLDSLAKSLGISMDVLKKRANSLRENNPMMGHRGVRLGITYPEITETQVKAILEASAELIGAGKKVIPEIMIPVVCDVSEVENQRKIIERVAKQVESLTKVNVPFLVGTMIEIPRAAITAGKIAEFADFFSFGTNDLTQMGFGFSRDDCGVFLPDYLDNGILADDPFQTIDQEGIGELIKIAVERGRRAKRDLKIGICGEHGGEARSVVFCHKIGMDYVSCSPFRIPIACLAAAQAAVQK